MSDPLDDIVVIEVAPQGAPGTGITAGQYNSLDADRNALNARANITKLDDVPDVVLAALATGQTISWDSTLLSGVGGWKNVNNPEAVAFVKNDDTNTILANADRLNFTSDGLTVVQNGTRPTQADISVRYGVAAGTVRAGNQNANPMIPNRWPFAATGVLSSGTRTLASNTSSVLVSGVPYDWTADVFVVCRNNVNTGTVNLTITVDGFSLSTIFQCVGGVPAAMWVPSGGQGKTGTGAGITVAATIAYDGGDASDVRAGFVRFDAYPRR